MRGGAATPTSATESRLWRHTPLSASFGDRQGLGADPGQSWDSPDTVAAPPPTVPRSKVLRLGARARKGLEMMSQNPGLFSSPSPGAWAPEEDLLAGQTGGRGRKREGRGDPT